jgi:hypothetical protein
VPATATPGDVMGNVIATGNGKITLINTVVDGEQRIEGNRMG